MTREIYVGDQSFLQGANIKVQKYQGVAISGVIEQFWVHIKIFASAYTSKHTIKRIITVIIEWMIIILLGGCQAWVEKIDNSISISGAILDRE